MSVKDLKEALHGPRGALDGYLECMSEDEVRADILTLTGTSQRAQFAAHAPAEIVRILANAEADRIKEPRGEEMHNGEYVVPTSIIADRMAQAAVIYTDALLNALSTDQGQTK